MEKFGKITLYNDDCMDILKQTPDKYYDLCIVDPPYGIGISSNPVRQLHSKKNWDNSIPKKEYFDELFRVSKNQIIWGGNYFIDYLYNTQCFIIWDKKQPMDFSLSMCEMAWTSFLSPAKIFTQSVLKEQMKIHPTQKPVQLYKWILNKYAKNDKQKKQYEDDVSLLRILQGKEIDFHIATFQVALREIGSRGHGCRHLHDLHVARHGPVEQFATDDGNDRHDHQQHENAAADHGHQMREPVQESSKRADSDLVLEGGKFLDCIDLLHGPLLENSFLNGPIRQNFSLMRLHGDESIPRSQSGIRSNRYNEALYRPGGLGRVSPVSREEIVARRKA